MATIALSGIEKSFGETRVLNSIDLTIEDSEFLTLVGPSGCGKSTLLRILAGLEAQDTGDVRIGDRTVNTVRAADRNLAMVFQSYALYPHLTVAENMLTPLRLRDLSFGERLPILGPLIARQKHLDLMDQVRQTAEILRIEALLDRKPGQLSGGQRQRAALGRAMVRKPVAFLMDEPLSNLDAALRVHMRAELAELHRALGATFVYVTHDQAEALTMSDRMAVMIDGGLLQLDAPEEVYGNPSDRRVAEFVGSPKINILPGAVDSDGRVTVLGAPLNRRLPAETKSVHIGIRPEHLLPADSTAGNDVWPFTVTHKENLGADFFLYGQLNGTGHRGIARFLPEDAASISIGSEIHLSARPGAAMAFAEDNSRLMFAGA